MFITKKNWNFLLFYNFILSTFFSFTFFLAPPRAHVTTTAEIILLPHLPKIKSDLSTPNANVFYCHGGSEGIPKWTLYPHRFLQLRRFHIPHPNTLCI